MIVRFLLKNTEILNNNNYQLRELRIEISKSIGEPTVNNPYRLMRVNGFDEVRV
jgi:hypothetical protein